MNAPSKTARPASPFWGCLDGIAIINLDDRPERWVATLAELAAFPGAPGPLRVPAVRGVDLPGYGQRPWFRGRPSDKRWAARVGCTLSHRKAMLLAREQGWRTFLILEDDACLQPLRKASLDDLQSALFMANPDWDVCYLGFSKAVGRSLQKQTLGAGWLCEVTGCYTTHAYLVRERARDWIIDQLPDEAQAWAWHAQHRIIDRWYVRHLSRALRLYAITPSVISQRVGFSDIVQRQVNYSDEFGGAMSPATRHMAWFNICRCLAHLRFMLGDRYDGVRGLFKRLNGF